MSRPDLQGLEKRTTVVHVRGHRARAERRPAAGVPATVIEDHLIAASPDHLLGQRTQLIRGEGSLDEQDGLAIAQHLGFEVDIADPDGLQLTHAGILAVWDADNNSAVGQLTVRADSAFYSRAVLGTAVKLGVESSVTARQDKEIRAAIEAAADRPSGDLAVRQVQWAARPGRRGVVGPPPAHDGRC